MVRSLLWFTVMGATTLLLPAGCSRLPAPRGLRPLTETQVMSGVPTLPAHLIPRQGYLEKGYSETGPPIYYTHNPHYVSPVQYAAPAPYASGPPYVPEAAYPMPSPTETVATRAPLVAGSMSPESALELRQNLEELHGKYNLVLEELTALRREVAANSEAIGHASQQIDATGEGLRKVRSTMLSWKNALDGLEERVKADRESQLSTLDDVESLLMNILASEERNRK